MGPALSLVEGFEIFSMSLTSSSTLDDALAQYNDNLDWEGDITKARNALSAIRWLLANRPKIVAANDRTFNFDSLEQEKKMLESFVTNFSSTVNRCSFVRGRPLT